MTAEEMFNALGYERPERKLFSERNGHSISYFKKGITRDYRQTPTIKRIVFIVKECKYNIKKFCTEELGIDSIEISEKEHAAITQQLKEIKIGGNK